MLIFSLLFVSTSRLNGFWVICYTANTDTCAGGVRGVLASPIKLDLSFTADNARTAPNAGCDVLFHSFRSGFVVWVCLGGVIIEVIQIKRPFADISGHIIDT